MRPLLTDVAVTHAHMEARDEGRWRMTGIHLQTGVLRGEDEEIGFLAGGGEMGARIRAFDWAGTSLGPPERWPQSLKTTVRLLLSSGHPMFIWWGPELLQFYNDAYARSIGPERHPGALGGPGRPCWAEIWDIIGPQIEQVMAGGGATWHENHLVPITRHGRREDVWWTYSYSPIDEPSAQSGVGGVLVICAETTERMLAERETARELESLGQLFGQAPTFMALLQGPEHRFQLANPSYQRLVGGRSVSGQSVVEALPESAEQGFVDLLDEVFRTGRPFVANGIRYLMPDTADQPVERFLDFVYQPITGSDGVVTGIFVGGADVTDRVLAEAALRESEDRFRAQAEHLRLMVDELNHRVKNTLATVQSVTDQTLRREGIATPVRQVLTSRLIALSRAHDVLTNENWSGANLGEIVAQAATPYQPERAERLRWRGPDVRLSPRAAIAFAMTLHELTTNAVKYGALSTPTGQVAIDWELRDDAGLRMTWRESGGPRVALPTRTGFGTRLIQRGLAGELGGVVRVDYAATGVVCTIEASSDALADRSVELLGQSSATGWAGAS